MNISIISKTLLKHKVFKNFSSLALGNILMQLINVFSIILITKVFLPKNFGLYSFMLVQSIMLSAIADLGLQNVIIRKLAINPNSKNEVFSTGIYSNIISNCFLLIIYLLYNTIFGRLSEVQVLLVALCSLIISISKTIDNILIGRQKMTPIAFGNISSSIIWLSTVFITINNNVTVNTLFILYIICYSTKPLILITYLFKYINIKIKIKLFSLNYLNLLKEAFPFFTMVLIALPANYFSNNFLELNSPIVEVGIFSLSQKFTTPITMILTVLLSALFPNLSELWTKDKMKFKNLLNTSIPIFIILGSIFVFIVSICIKPVFTLLFDKEYQHAVVVFKVHIWYIYLMGVSSFLGNIWNAMNKEKLSLQMAIINTIINIPVLWYGSKHGALGLASAYVFSFSIFMIVLFIVFSSSTKLNAKVSFSWIIPTILFTLAYYL